MRQIAAYLALTFAISWIGALLVIGGPQHIPATRDEFERLLPLVALTLTAGPCGAGLLLTGLLSGRAGYRELTSRLLRWRVGARWYAVALLTVPVLMAGVLLALSLFSTQFLPPIVTTGASVSQILVTAAAACVGALCEELGWTGFAVPRLRARYTIVATGMIVGVVWGAWHFLVNVWASRGLAGDMSLTLFVPLYLLGGVAQLTAYRVLMVWVHDATRSLFVVTLMHAALIVGTVQTILTPPTTGPAFLSWFFLLTAAMWTVVARVARA